MKALEQTTQLSSKGQIVIPQAIRKIHAWKAGLTFLVEDKKEGLLLKPLKPFQLTALEEVIGCTKYRGSSKSLADMERAIENEAKRHKK